MSPVPFGRRDRLISEVGPERIGSKPGFACIQMPDRSGTAFVLSLAAPKAGVRAATANTSPRGKFRRCESMALLPLCRHYAATWHKLHPVRMALEGDRNQIA